MHGLFDPCSARHLRFVCVKVVLVFQVLGYGRRCHVWAPICYKKAYNIGDLTLTHHKYISSRCHLRSNAFLPYGKTMQTEGKEDTCKEGTKVYSSICICIYSSLYRSSMLPFNSALIFQSYDGVWPLHLCMCVLTHFYPIKGIPWYKTQEAASLDKSISQTSSDRCPISRDPHMALN